ncbi:MAG: restriction endonuclease [Phycisphaerales bacterium]|nr:restriction endonuclease [Phycisphaerales bacterium]MCI0677186.1 restriction endonuclease [Phycisphaerales bacterium]
MDFDLGSAPAVPPRRTLSKTHIEMFLGILLLAAIPACVYFWGARGVSIWLAFAGAILIVFALTDAGIKATRSSTRDVQEKFWYLLGSVIVAWVALTWFAESNWLTGGYRLLIGSGALAVLSVIVDFVRKTRYFLDKCQHGVRRRADGTRHCEECERIERARAEQLQAERERAEQAKAERRRAMQEIALATIHELDQLKRLDPFLFEDLVLLTYEQLGWSVQSGKRTGDGGIDGIVMRNGTTLIVQCKRFVRGDVGAPLLRDLLGTVTKHKATGGVLITTSGFSKEARAWCQDLPHIELVDGHRLLVMIRQAFGSASAIPERFAMALERSNNLCSPCPECGQTVRIIEGRSGSFIGCSGYPNCRWTCRLQDEFIDPSVKTKGYLRTQAQKELIEEWMSNPTHPPWGAESMNSAIERRIADIENRTKADSGPKA